MPESPKRPCWQSLLLELWGAATVISAGFLLGLGGVFGVYVGLSTINRIWGG